MNNCNNNIIKTNLISLENNKPIYNKIPNQFCYIPNKNIDDNNNKIIKKTKDTLPIYIIKAHSNISLKTNIINNNIVLNDENISKLPNNSYIIDTIPFNTQMELSCSNYDFINNIVNNPTLFKELIFNNDFIDCFNYHYDDYYKEPIFFKYKPSFMSPGYSFINKKFSFWETEQQIRFNNDKLGIFESKQDSNIDLTTKNFFTPSTPLIDKQNSNLLNYDEINDTILFDIKTTEKQQRVKNLRELLKNSIINKSFITLDNIISILGEGIYVLVSCSNVVFYLNNEKINSVIDNLEYETQKPLNDIQKNKMNFYKEYNLLLYNTFSSIINTLNYTWNNMIYNIDTNKKRKYNINICHRNFKDFLPDIDIDSDFNTTSPTKFKKTKTIKGGYKKRYNKNKKRKTNKRKKY